MKKPHTQRLEEHFMPKDQLMQRPWNETDLEEPRDTEAKRIKNQKRALRQAWNKSHRSWKV